MSHMTAQIHLYDCMGDVVISIHCTDHDQSQAWEDRTYTRTYAFPGTGEDNHAKWLRDALMEAIEVL